ncbi:MAG: response regulator [Maritimibacter sp.]|nr:response regulator [Maritimibacter sp.]
MSKTTKKFSPEVRERAVRLVLDNAGRHESRWQAIVSVAAKIGCSANTLNAWVMRAEVDGGYVPNWLAVQRRDTVRSPHTLLSICREYRQTFDTSAAMKPRAEQISASSADQMDRCETLREKEVATEEGHCEGNMRILVIDDDPGILGLVTLFLSESGNHEAVGALSAKEALEAVAESDMPFDCFLVDIQMPNVDGITLVRLVRQTPGYEDSPIIMLTAMREKQYLDRAFSAGATDYLSKPFDFLELARRLHSAQKACIEKALLRSQPLMAGEFKGMAGEPKDIRLDAPLPLPGIDEAIDYAEFENYVRQVRLRRDSGLTAVAVKVGHVHRAFAAYTSDAFKSLVMDAARAVQEILLQNGGVLSYRGNGIFLCILEKRLKDRRRVLQKKLSARLSKQHQPVDGILPDLILGDFVALGDTSDGKALETLASALDSAEGREATLGSFLDVPRRLLRRQRLSGEQMHLERRTYETLLRDTSVAPTCENWNRVLRRRKNALRGA